VGGIWGQTRCLGDRTLGRRTWPSARWSVKAGCGTRIWGQTRCPIYRSGTFNVQRLTLNVKRGDRNGERWAGYGDRHDIHDIWAPGFLTRTSPSACQPVETHWGLPLPEKGDRHGAWATGLLTAGPGRAPGGRSRPAAAPGYGDRHDVRYADHERST